MYTKSELMHMLGLQSGMNEVVNPEWLSAGYPWLLAAFVESAEAIDHYGFKWWSNQTPNIEQVQLELVDIWHFGMSHLIVQGEGDLDEVAENIEEELKFLKGDPNRDLVSFDGKQYLLSDMDVREKLRLMGGLMAANRFEVSVFFSLVNDTGLNATGLYKSYVGKCVLNHFRQENGYKQGHYSKTWGGREDNEHLQEILNELDSTGPNVETTIKSALKARYEQR